MKLGIQSPDSFYADGKVKGKTSRDKNIEGPKLPEKGAEVVRKAPISESKESAAILTDEVEIALSRKPSLNEMPKLVERGKASDIPSFLEGFKPNKRK